MPPEPSDVITVCASHAQDVSADRADLFVVITGASLVTGNAALSKAREVRQLVADLAGAGIAESDVRLQGIHAQTASGVLGKSSSATYRLKIHVANLDRLADVLGAVTSQKNTTLRTIVWGYPDDAENVRAAWLDDCIRRANEKARRIAASLGVTLRGVQSFTESFVDEEEPPHFAHDLDALAFSRRRAAPLTSEDLGLEVSHAKRVEMRVTVAYHVSRFAATE